MPPLRKPAAKKRKADSGDEPPSEPSSESDVSVEVDSEDEKPKKKAKSAAKKPAAKKAPAKAEPKSPAKAPTPKKAPNPTEPFDDEAGFHNDPTPDRSIMYKDFGTKPSARIACIDLDGTLIQTKSGFEFPTDAKDWKWFSDKVPEVVKQYHEDGYKLVIISNQGGVKGALNGASATKLKAKMNLIHEALGVPFTVLMAPGNNTMRKPKPGMWNLLCEQLNGGVAPDKSQCFYIGDMAGRDADKSDSDKEFARNAGIGFKVPEDVFGPRQEGGPKGSGGAVEEVEGPNGPLITAFYKLAEAVIASGADKANFKAAAYKKAAASLETFKGVISSSNLKEVGKLQGVGKGSLEKIQEFLETGTFKALLELQGGAGASKTAKEAAVSKAANASVAAAFM